MNDRSLDPLKRRERFREAMLSITDMKRVALFTLGPYANRTSESDTAIFTEAFTDFVTAVYQRGLDGYAGRPMRVIDSAHEGFCFRGLTRSKSWKWHEVRDFRRAGKKNALIGFDQSGEGLKTNKFRELNHATGGSDDWIQGAWELPLDDVVSLLRNGQQKWFAVKVG